MTPPVSIVIPVKDKGDGENNLLRFLSKHFDDVIVSSKTSRATSLNAGVQRAKHDMIWFLHADSKISSENILALKSAISDTSGCLYYFDLDFDDNGPVQLNAIGANLRSRIFDLPYGDQGLCISKKHFERLGGYPEDAAYGEDLLFVRKAKKHGIVIMPVRSKIRTSARRYKTQGWLKTTLIFQLRMWKLIWTKI